MIPAKVPPSAGRGPSFGQWMDKEGDAPSTMPSEFAALISERVSSLSSEQAETLRHMAVSVVNLLGDALAAPLPERASRYRDARAEGARRGLLVACLPDVLDANTERQIRGIVQAAALVDRTLGNTTTH